MPDAEASSYDHNQTLVADSFIALFIHHGRLTAGRAEIERRHEFAEDLAQQIATLPSLAAADGAADRRAALAHCRAGLLAEPAQLGDAEAGWVVRRVAELRGWDGPDG